MNVLVIGANGRTGRLVISSMYADRPEQGPAFLRSALLAKQRSARVATTASLDWTIIHPGGLTDDPGTGRVTVDTNLRGGRVPRQDVAHVAVAALAAPATIRRAFDLVSGDTPIDESLTASPA
ncbi:MAG: NAD(P)H-binding protein [Acidimicrobiales bacterium]